MRLGEKADDVGRHVVADAVHVEEAGAGRAVSGSCAASISSRQWRERAVMPREQPRRRLPDLRDAERVDEAVERDAPALVDRGDQLVGADLAPAFAADDLLGVRGGRCRRAGGSARPARMRRCASRRAPRCRSSRARRNACSRSTACAGADQPAGAAPRHHAFLAHREAVADRAMVGEFVGLARPAGGGRARPRRSAGSRRRRAGR